MLVTEYFSNLFTFFLRTHLYITRNLHSTVIFFRCCSLVVVLVLVDNNNSNIKQNNTHARRVVKHAV